MSIKPKEGDFVITDSRWSLDRYAVRQVTKVTAQMYSYMVTGGERRAYLDDILFASSSEDFSLMLAGQLRAADRVYEEEKIKSHNRWIEQKHRLIEEAKSR